MPTPASEEAPGPRALLVDFGGVLTRPVSGAFARLGREHGLPEDAVGRLLSEPGPANTALVEHEKGRLDDEGFDDALAEAMVGLGASPRPTDLLRRLSDLIDIEPTMVEWVRGVRARGVPVALVSNALGRDCYARLDLPALFDATVVSSELGVRKPSREIYRVAAERLGVDPAECVLVDDLPQNLAGAARLGVHGVLHERPQDTIAAVDHLLPGPDRAPTTDRNEDTTCSN